MIATLDAEVIVFSKRNGQRIHDTRCPVSIGVFGHDLQLTVKGPLPCSAPTVEASGRFSMFASLNDKVRGSNDTGFDANCLLEKSRRRLADDLFEFLDKVGLVDHASVTGNSIHGKPLLRPATIFSILASERTALRRCQ